MNDSCALAKLGLAKVMAATPGGGEGAALLMDAEGLLRAVLASDDSEAVELRAASLEALALATRPGAAVL